MKGRYDVTHQTVYAIPGSNLLCLTPSVPRAHVDNLLNVGNIIGATQEQIFDGKKYPYFAHKSYTVSVNIKLQPATKSVNKGKESDSLNLKIITCTSTAH